MVTYCEGSVREADYLFCGDKKPESRQTLVMFIIGCSLALLCFVFLLFLYIFSLMVSFIRMGFALTVFGFLLRLCGYNREGIVYCSLAFLDVVFFPGDPSRIRLLRDKVLILSAQVGYPFIS